MVYGLSEIILEIYPEITLGLADNLRINQLISNISTHWPILYTQILTFNNII